jgi:hypothetical protein
MKLSHVLLAVGTVGMAACTSTAPIAGIESAKFARYECATGGFSARMSEDGRSIRLRAKEGSADLDAQSDGSFKGEGYTLVGAGERGIALQHNGKWVAERCKKDI